MRIYKLVALIVLMMIFVGCQSTPVMVQPTATVTAPASTGESSPTPMPTATTTQPPPNTPTPYPSRTPAPQLPSSPALTNPAFTFYASDGTINIATEDGSDIRPLARPLGRVGDTPWLYFWTNPPQFSPDGRWLLTHTSVSEARGNWELTDLYTGAVSASGSGQSSLTPTWAPHSETFAYLKAGQLCLYTLADANEHCIPIADDLFGAAWAPSGETIAIAQADLEGDCCGGEVWLFDVAAQTAAPIGRYDLPPQASVDEAFEWSADGQLLLLKSATEGVPATLYTPADGATRTLDKPVRALSPDGRLVIDPSGEVAALDGSVSYSLPSNAACPQPSLGIHNWEWSPDGGRLAFLLRCAAAETSWLYVLAADTGAIVWERELGGLGNSFPLEFVYWTADASSLLLDEVDELYEGKRTLSPIWRVPADGSAAPTVVVKAGFLLGVGGIQASQPVAATTPTADLQDALIQEGTLLYTSLEKGAFPLWSYPALAALNQPLFETAYGSQIGYLYAGDFKPTPDPTGRYLLVPGVDETQGEGMQAATTWIVDLESGMAREIEGAPESAVWSPNGEQFAYVADGTLYLETVGDATSRRPAFSNTGLSGFFLAWSPDSQYVAITSAELEETATPIEGAYPNIITTL